MREIDGFINASMAYTCNTGRKPTEAKCSEKTFERLCSDISEMDRTRDTIDLGRSVPFPRMVTINGIIVREDESMKGDGYEFYNEATP